MRSILRSYRSPLTPLLLALPLGLALAHAGASVNPLLVFLVNGLAIVPLAQLISESVERISERLGDQLGGILNATFGNLVELVIAISALTGGLYDVVLDGLVGGLVTNLLLVLGVATLVGGLQYRRLTINSSATLLNAKLLLAVMLVAFVPSALNHLSMFRSGDHHENYSIFLSVTLLLFYALSHVYQFVTHGDEFKGQAVPLPFDLEALEEAEGTPHVAGSRGSMSSAVAVLCFTTLLLVFSSEALVDGLSGAVSRFGLHPFFTGVFLLPLFGSAAEFLIAVRAAKRNRLDLAVATTVGSSIQIVLFVLPVLVLVGALIGRPLGIFFNPASMVAVVASVFAVQWVTEDNSLDWFEGSFLVLVYLLLAASSLFLL
jgi:Ca2+:H+ antiporter